MSSLRLCNSLCQRLLQLDGHFVQVLSRLFSFSIAPIDEDLVLQIVECAERHAPLGIIKALIALGVSSAGALIRRTGIEGNVFLQWLLMPAEDVARI